LTVLLHWQTDVVGLMYVVISNLPHFVIELIWDEDEELTKRRGLL